MNKEKTKLLLELIKEHPDLPVLPMVDGEVVGDDNARWWLGLWSYSEVKKFYIGKEYIHFSDDDEEDVLNDMEGCKYGMTADGRDIYDLSDEEWKEVYDGLPWVEAIVVYITAR